jgi:hypothetical protein
MPAAGRSLDAAGHTGATDQPSFTAAFANCGRFPDVLFLAPNPDGPFRALTADLFQR